MPNDALLSIVVFLIFFLIYDIAMRELGNREKIRALGLADKVLASSLHEDEKKLAYIIFENSNKWRFVFIMFFIIGFAIVKRRKHRSKERASEFMVVEHEQVKDLISASVVVSMKSFPITCFVGLLLLSIFSFVMLLLSKLKFSDVDQVKNDVARKIISNDDTILT